MLDDAGDPRREVLDDLRLLERSGEVHSRILGARARAWWHDDRVVPAPPEDPADHPDQSALDEAREFSRDPRRDMDVVDADQEDNAGVDVGVLPGGIEVDEARAAITAAIDVLEERGSATKSEIVREVMPEYPLGYDVEAAHKKLDSDDRYRGAWWRRVVKVGLKNAENVEKPPQGRREWKYRD